MGESNVFSIWFTRFIGIGISFSICHITEQLSFATRQPKVYKVLDISISIPFIGIGIYCRKSKDNEWFVKR